MRPDSNNPILIDN